MTMTIRIPKKVTGSFPYPANKWPRPAPNLRSPFPAGKIGIPDLPSQVPSLAAAATAPAPTITQRAQGEIDPILKRITDAITARARSAGQAITGYSTQLAGDLGKIDYGAPYAGAEQQQAAVDAALHQSLSGAGSSLAGDLSTRLAQIGDPAVAAAAGNVAATGTAAGNTELARGSSNLGALIANAAAAKSYGLKLPGIARLAGLQDLSAANGAAQQQIGDQTAQVETQLPSIVNAIRSGDISAKSFASTDAYRKATLHQGDVKTKAALILANGVDPKTGTLTPQASKALTKLLGVSGLTGVSASTAARAGYEGATLTERQRHDQAIETLQQSRLDTSNVKTAAQLAPKVSSSLSRAFGYRVDQYGNPWGGKVTLLPGYGFNAKGDVVKRSSGGSKSHGLTQNEILTKKGLATTIAQNAINGFTDKKGVVHPPLGYADAVLEMEKEGVPDWLGIPAVNEWYKAGGKHSTIAGPPAPNG